MPVQDSYPVPPVTAAHLNIRQLDLLEKTFLQRANQARVLGHWLSRRRLWLIFVLVRHGGLRLGEAIELDDARDLNLDTGQVRVRGAHPRTVLLSPALLPELRQFLAHDLVAARQGKLTQLDPGYIRRNFYARAKEIGLPPDLASPRALRMARAIELIHNGMPLPAIQQYLGQPSLVNTAQLLNYSEDEIKRITRHYLQREARLKTSARNVFPGQVCSIARDNFLVDVRLNSFSGLQLAAIITAESMDNLQLSLGKTVVATVKAPFVQLARANHPIKNTVNKFAGRVERIANTEILSEVVVALPEGGTCCSVTCTDSLAELELQEGRRVCLFFNALSVVLALP